MGFSDKLREKAEHIWRAIFQHPFIAGISDGTLPLEKFKFYICQDYLFLVDFSKVLALAAAKPSDPSTMAKFAQLLHQTMSVEMGLHRSYASKFGISEEQLTHTRPSPVTLAYTSYLLRASHEGTLGQLSAALLPCMWSYPEVGRELTVRGEPQGQPLYAEWIRMYSSEDFWEVVRWGKGLLDTLASQAAPPEIERMEEAFITSSRYEYMFWDMAYRMEEWPI